MATFLRMLHTTRNSQELLKQTKKSISLKELLLTEAQSKALERLANQELEMNEKTQKSPVTILFWTLGYLPFAHKLPPEKLFFFVSILSNLFGI